MAKQHKASEGEQILILGAMGVGGYFLWKHFAGVAAPAAGAAAPLTASVAGQNVAITPLTPPASSSASSSAGAAATVIPAVPLNSPDTLVGSVNGTQIVEAQPVYSPYGTVYPSNFATQNDPRTGLQPPTDIVPAVQSPTVIAVPGVQGPVDICASGPAFANNNPTGANRNQSYSSLHDGLVAAFQELQGIYNSYGQSAFTISGVANYWVNVNGDGLPWGQANPAANQVGFEASMVSLTGLNDYAVDLWTPHNVGLLMRGLVGTFSGPQYFSAISDACLTAAFNAAFGASATTLN